MRAKDWHGTALLLMLVPWPAGALAATVLSIGDTIRVRQAGRSITVRLACIDAPETPRVLGGNWVQPPCSGLPEQGS